MSKIVIKVGGALIGQPYAQMIAQDVAQLVRNKHQVVLVHGGGPQLDSAIREQQRTPTNLAGRRVTSAEDIKLAVRVWRGDISTRWVQQLSQQGIAALGLTGQDAHLIRATKRPMTKVRTANGLETEVDFGYVGDIRQMNTTVLTALWNAGVVPVVAPLGGDNNGHVLNINADTIATRSAVSLGADELILLSNEMDFYSICPNPLARYPVSIFNKPGLFYLMVPSKRACAQKWNRSSTPSKKRGFQCVHRKRNECPLSVSTVDR